ALPFVPAATRAEIYVCTGKAKLTVYQNFPCQFDSIGLLPMPALDATPRPVAAESIAVTPPPPIEPRSGMTKEDVRAIWGEPRETESGSDEEGLAGRSETWSYGATREVRFVDDHVFAIRK